MAKEFEGMMLDKVESVLNTMENVDGYFKKSVKELAIPEIEGYVDYLESIPADDVEEKERATAHFLKRLEKSTKEYADEFWDFYVCPKTVKVGQGLSVLTPDGSTSYTVTAKNEDGTVLSTREDTAVMLGKDCNGIIRYAEIGNPNGKEVTLTWDDVKSRYIGEGREFENGRRTFRMV